MAKYLTVICKVKGETILRLINDFNCVEDNVFYHKNIEDKSDATHNHFDLRLVKQEPEEVVQPLLAFNDNSDERLESDEYLDDYHNYDYHWNRDNRKDSDGSGDERQQMDDYKKYLSIMKTTGRQLFCCKYKKCKYQTLWKNAIINHIRSNHTHFLPFICGFADCGKKFAIRSNLNNHRKVHSKRPITSRHNSELIRGFDHNYSQNIFSNNSYLNKESESDYNTNCDKTLNQNKRRFAQNISKNIKKKIIVSKQRVFKRKRNRKKKTIKIESNIAMDSANQSSNGRPSSAQTPAFVGIKSVEQFIKQTEQNGKIWRSCLFPECSYGSRYATSIVYHIRNQHLNDKPYVCPNCGKSFAMRTNLNNHKKVHKTTKALKT